MYENCPLKGKVCPLCFVSGGLGQTLICSKKVGENEIQKMKCCPKKKKR